jgi:hypothetical protein
MQVLEEMYFLDLKWATVKRWISCRFILENCT